MADQDTKLAPAREARSAPSFTEQLIEPLSRLRSEVDRLFDDFPLRLPTFGFSGITAFSAPAVEMTETKKAYKLTAELPGLAADDIEVSCEDGVLRIAGEKKEEREEDEQGYRFSERSYGRFERFIELPAAAEGEKAKASFRNGVLRISIPKDGRTGNPARKIPVATT